MSASININNYDFNFMSFNALSEHYPCPQGAVLKNSANTVKEAT